jgi:hypothetical protein
MNKGWVFLSVGLLVLAIWPASLQAQYAFWHYDRLIENNGPCSAINAHVAVSGAKAVAVWCQKFNDTYRVYSNYSTNGGATWGNARIIEDNVGSPAYNSRVAVSGSNVVAVWTQFVGSFMRVHANYSSDGGATWHSDQLIENNTNAHADAARVAISGTRVVAVWFQVESGFFRIFSNYSTNGGATWHTDQSIDSLTVYDSEYPQVALSGANAVAVWFRSDGSKQRIYSNWSGDGGATWHPEQRIEDNSSYHASNPQVAMSGTKAVAVWEQASSSGNWRVYYNFTTNGGQTWHSDQLVSDQGLQAQTVPQVAVSGTTAVVIWRQAGSTGPGLVFSSCSIDSGATWFAAQAIETNTGYSAENPRLALSGTKASAVWRQSDGGTMRIFANYSPDGGATWRSERMIDGIVSGGGVYPEVAVSSNDVVAVWLAQSDATNRPAANYATYTASSKVMLLPPKMTSPASGSIDIPTTVVFQWQDTNSNPQELKYKIRLKPAGGVYANIPVPAYFTSCAVAGLIRNKTYYWNIQAVGNGTSILTSGWANGGVDWKFTTIH